MSDFVGVVTLFCMKRWLLLLAVGVGACGAANTGPDRETCAASGVGASSSAWAVTWRCLESTPCPDLPSALTLRTDATAAPACIDLGVGTLAFPTSADPSPTICFDDACARRLERIEIWHGFTDGHLRGAAVYVDGGRSWDVGLDAAPAR